MKTTQYRQGDVLIERVSTPTPAQEPNKEKRFKRIVLAEGEATGHAHALEVDAADWWKDGDAQFVSVSKPAKVVHDEHGVINLPAGTYRITRQREYTPEAIRNVAD